MNKLITITIEQYADLLKTEYKYNALKRQLEFMEEQFKIDEALINSYKDKEIVKKLGSDYEVIKEETNE